LDSLTKTRLLVGLLLVISQATAGEINGRVVKVNDGDTLTVLVDRRQVRVRLTDIDAPERKQAFGTRSRQSLAELCAGKDARIADQGKDRYGRTLGRVNCAGVDANAEQVRRGMAWVFERYAPENSLLYAVHAEARAAKRGLWADANPVPPWEWRRRKSAR
jgi:endonuclease YncB( thermonuclease family)